MITFTVTLSAAYDQAVTVLVRTFDRPMGLAVDGGRLAIGTRKEVWFLRDAPDIAPRIEPAGHHDACFLPRSSQGEGPGGDLLGSVSAPRCGTMTHHGGHLIRDHRTGHGAQRRHRLRGAEGPAGR